MSETNEQNTELPVSAEKRLARWLLSGTDPELGQFMRLEGVNWRVCWQAESLAKVILISPAVATLQARVEVLEKEVQEYKGLSTTFHRDYASACGEINALRKQLAAANAGMGNKEVEGAINFLFPKPQGPGPHGTVTFFVPDNCTWSQQEAVSTIIHAARQRSRDRHNLLNLLALIHRDGGHYETTHGTEKAVEDAMSIVRSRVGEDAVKLATIARDNLHLTNDEWEKVKGLVDSILAHANQPQAPAIVRQIDGKFATDSSGNIVKIASGEIVPVDEPLLLMRARDRLALPAIRHYRELSAKDGCKTYHFENLDAVIAAFEKFATEKAEWMKQPSITEGKVFVPLPQAGDAGKEGDIYDAVAKYRESHPESITDRRDGNTAQPSPVAQDGAGDKDLLTKDERTAREAIRGTRVYYTKDILTNTELGCIVQCLMAIDRLAPKPPEAKSMSSKEAFEILEKYADKADHTDIDIAIKCLKELIK